MLMRLQEMAAASPAQPGSRVAGRADRPAQTQPLRRAISRNPELRQRDISELVGITEGAVQRILHELEEDGYIARERIGRRNRYAVIGNRPLRHPLEDGHTIEEINDTVNRSDAATD